MKKIILLATLACALVACHSEKEEKKEEKKVEKEFRYNDYNDVQIPAAEKFGIQPIASRDADFSAIKELAKVEDNDTLLKIEPLTHSVPYLTHNAKALLLEIARDFQDSLKARGARPYRIHVTSMLRTLNDVERLVKHNSNASEKSAHCYGTTMDIAHNNFDPSPAFDKAPGKSLSINELKHLLGHVLYRLRMQKKCWVLIEERQKCYHLTVNS
ncbi:MAG: DUF5715 family protein [Bacteroidales bacterium]|nr:DUF5715 family protein [Bacteroidales bacterium]